MKKILIGLLFCWIIIFSIIGYTQYGDQIEGETVEYDSGEQRIVQ